MDEDWKEAERSQKGWNSNKESREPKNRFKEDWEEAETSQKRRNKDTEGREEKNRWKCVAGKQKSEMELNAIIEGG